MSVFELLSQTPRPFDCVVQVGAHAGQEVKPFRKAGLKRAIMIEPADEPYARLCAAIGDDERFIPVQAVCSSLDGEPCDFFVGTSTEASSTLKPKRVLSEYPEIGFEAPIRMTARTVDSIVAEVERARPDFSARQIDLLYIDTQGAELKVMMGATRVLQYAQSVWTEVSYDLYEGGASLEDLQGFLKAFGFRLHHIDVNDRGWGDALFAKPPR